MRTIHKAVPIVHNGFNNGIMFINASTICQTQMYLYMIIYEK